MTMILRLLYVLVVPPYVVTFGYRLNCLHRYLVRTSTYCTYSTPYGSTEVRKYLHTQSTKDMEVQYRTVQEFPRTSTSTGTPYFRTGDLLSADSAKSAIWSAEPHLTVLTSCSLVIALLVLPGDTRCEEIGFPLFRDRVSQRAHVFAKMGEGP